MDEKPLEDVMGELRSLYDLRRGMEEQMAEATAKLRADLAETTAAISERERHVSKIAEASALNVFEHADIQIMRKAGRRAITAKVYEIPEKDRSWATKTTVQMITISEMDRLLKDRQDLSAEYVHTMLGLEKKDSWVVSDIKAFKELETAATGGTA
jgi:hypothetical protein